MTNHPDHNQEASEAINEQIREENRQEREARTPEEMEAGRKEVIKDQKERIALLAIDNSIRLQALLQSQLFELFTDRGEPVKGVTNSTADRISKLASAAADCQKLTQI